MKNKIKKYYNQRMVEIIEGVEGQDEFVDMFLEQDIFDEIVEEFDYDVEPDFQEELIEMKNAFRKFHNELISHINVIRKSK